MGDLNQGTQAGNAAYQNNSVGSGNRWEDMALGWSGMGQWDPTNGDRGSLQQAAAQQGQFGQNLQGQYLANQQGINSTQNMLYGLANGQNSVSAAQLQQGLQQSQAQQMSMAAGAAPQNQAMAARTAMNNAGGQASGMMGQQSMAGLQERQGALNALAQMQMQQSGQNMQGALGAYQGQNQAYGSTLQTPQKGVGNMFGGGIGGVVGALAG